MKPTPAQIRELPEARPLPTTRLESPAPTQQLDATDEPGPKSLMQHALEIIAPIVAFLAVAILTEPMAQAIREEIPGAIAATVLIVARVLACFYAARHAARWVSR